jgi:hypothetical protein
MKLVALVLASLLLGACGVAPTVTSAPRTAQVASLSSSPMKAIERAVVVKLTQSAKDEFRTITVTNLDVSVTNTPGAFTFTAQIKTKSGGKYEQSGTYEAASGRINILIDTSITPAPIPSSFR